MENTDQGAYVDSKMLRQESLRRPQTPQRTVSSTSTSSEAIEPPAYTNSPYLDSPPQPYHDNSPTNPNTPCSQLLQQPPVFRISAPGGYHSPVSSPRDLDSEDDDNVPLAQLLLYPRDAPPAYSTVVQQPYRETLLQHILRYPVVMDADEEAALERIRAEDVSFSVERAVATAVVMALLVLAGVLIGLLLLRN